MSTNPLEADLATLEVVVRSLRSVANESSVDASVVLDAVADDLENRIAEIAATGGPVEGD